MKKGPPKGKPLGWKKCRMGPAAILERKKSKGKMGSDENKKSNNNCDDNRNLEILKMSCVKIDKNFKNIHQFIKKSSTKS